MIKQLIITAFILFSVCALAGEPRSINVLEFAADNVLFAGDSHSGTIYAYQLGATESTQSPPAGYNVDKIDKKIAHFLGTTAKKVRIQDLAVHPVTKEAYLAVSRTIGERYISAIVIIDREGNIRHLNLRKTPHTQYKVTDAPTSEHKFWARVALRSFTFTDIDYYQGQLYVSGLSNAEFSSVLRIIPYPFPKSSHKTVSVEIYHANHDQNETRAPIRTLEIVELKGKDYLLAAYTCTPLVTIPLDELSDGKHIVGKTIAEVGYGNTPLDLIQFTTMIDNKPVQAIFLCNKNQSAQVFTMTDVVKSNDQPGILYPTNFKNAGTPFFNVPMTSILHAALLDQYHILTVRRNLETGSLQLYSYLAGMGLYFRLSDFEGEYEFPDYEYPASQEWIKELHKTLKKDEGFSE